MCTPATSLTFTGSIAVNGNETRYTNQSVPIPTGFSNCISRNGNVMTIQTRTPVGTFTNNLTDVNGRITGTMRFPGATINLNGTGQFK